MKNRTVVLFIDGDETGGVYECGAIWYEGHWWILPKPEEPPSEGRLAQRLLARPLSGIAWESESSLRTVLQDAVPKAVLDGYQAPGWEVLLVEVEPRPRAH